MVYTQEEYDRALIAEAHSDPYFFTKYMFRARRKFPWQGNWHHEEVAKALKKIYTGESTRLIINEPPRYSKTQQAVVDFIAWCMGKVPDSEFIHTSYSARLAGNNSFQVKQTVELPDYQKIFPKVHLRADSKAKDEWRTTEGGVMYATGSQGTITGYGAGKMREGFGGAIIIDDPHKPDEAASDVMRENVIEWFDSTLASRTNSPHTPIILIMQRLHEQDLSGWLLGGGNGEHWDHVCIPAIYTDKEGNDAALWPDKHSLERLREMERSNPYVFAGQYMQRPAPLGGGIFKDDWWQYWTGWRDRSTWPNHMRVVQSWDTAQKTKEQNDYSVCTTWLQAANGYYLVDIFKKKMESPELRRTAKSLAEKFQPHAILIEDKSSGTGLIQDLRTDTRLPVIAIQKNTDKVFCANEVTPIVESRKVFLPDGHPETPAYVLSHGQFPNAAHDDDVDSTTQALKWMSRGHGMSTIPMSGS